MATIFLDTFTDANGTLLAAHTPDTAPTNFVWHASPLIINASDQAVVDPTYDPGFDFGFSDIYDDLGVTDWGLSLPYTVTMVARHDPVTLSDLRTEFVLTDDTGTDNALYVSLLQDANGVFKAEALAGHNGVFYNSTVTASNTVSHNLQVYVEATQITFSVDGVAQAPVALTTTSTYKYGSLSICRGASYVDMVRIETGVPPPPPPPPPPPDPDTSGDPIIKRGTVKLQIGTQVDDLTLSLLCNSETTVANLPIPQFARQGGFDGATLEVVRDFYAYHGAESCGQLHIFSGRVSEIQVTGTQVDMTIKSDLELLNVQLPRNLYMAQCRHTLYDEGCGLVKASFTVTGNTTSGSSTTSINCNLAQAAGYFDLGTIHFTSGQLAGVVRSVKRHPSTGVLVPILPLPSAPVAGDLFEATPGCDKLMATCNAKFTNLANFGGAPFIPAPETTF